MENKNWWKISISRNAVHEEDCGIHPFRP